MFFKFVKWNRNLLELPIRIYVEAVKLLTVLYERYFWAAQLLETQLVLHPVVTLHLILGLRSKRDDSSFDYSEVRFEDVLVVSEVSMHVVFIYFLTFDNYFSLDFVII